MPISIQMQLVWHSVTMNLTVNPQVPTLGRDRTLLDFLEIFCIFLPAIVRGWFVYIARPRTLLMSPQQTAFGTGIYWEFNPSVHVMVINFVEMD